MKIHFTFPSAILILLTGCATFYQFSRTGFKASDPYIRNVGDQMLGWEVGWKTRGSPPEYRSGLGKELVYVGSDRGVVHVKYREFSLTTTGDYARDAFYLDLRYDLSKSDTITYRDVVIVVDSADQEAIRYRILSMPSELNVTSGRIGILNDDDGRILEVEPMSPASRAGLRVGDIIKRIDDVIVDPGDMNSFRRRLMGPAGTRVKVLIVRDGREREISVDREVR